MDKRENMIKFFDKINAIYFQGVMPPTWYADIEQMIDKYGFSHEVVEELINFCFEKRELERKFALKVAYTWYKNGIRTQKDVKEFLENKIDYRIEKIIKNMITLNFDANMISKITEIPIKEIDKIFLENF